MEMFEPTGILLNKITDIIKSLAFRNIKISTN